jgi:hypothetical protein
VERITAVRAYCVRAGESEVGVSAIRECVELGSSDQNGFAYVGIRNTGRERKGGLQGVGAIIELKCMTPDKRLATSVHPQLHKLDVPVAAETGGDSMDAHAMERGQRRRRLPR